jgi:ferredoxin
MRTMPLASTSASRVTISALLLAGASDTQQTASALVARSPSFFAAQWRHHYFVKVQKCSQNSRLFSSPYNNDDDANRWSSSDGNDDNEDQDWEDKLRQRSDPGAWSAFESSAKEEFGSTDDDASGTEMSNEDESEVWLNALQSISAEEVEFNIKENDRADKARRMQEWGFTAEAIEGALGVAVDDTLEKENDEKDAALIDEFRQSEFGMMLDDDTDLKVVESHIKVEIDDASGEPVRSQMVYVDEHTCIGCTNCAMIAPSTFFMEDWLGRARVFEQWGDDDETIKIAIETCPVDCIHYVPYDELVSLEVHRRGQNINFKAALVNKTGDGHRVGGAVGFTDAPIISGNMGSRCNNCPSGKVARLFDAAV